MNELDKINSIFKEKIKNVNTKDDLQSLKSDFLVKMD